MKNQGVLKKADRGRGKNFGFWVGLNGERYWGRDQGLNYYMNYLSTMSRLGWAVTTPGMNLI